MSNLADIAKFNGSIPLHPAGHVKLFLSEPLVYTNPHIWAAYLFTMLGLGITALYLFFHSRNEIEITTDVNRNSVDILFTGEEEAFWRLKMKYDLLRERIKSLDFDYNCGNLELDDYTKDRKLHEQLIIEVKRQLKEYT